jgi:uncharacterized protein YwgA
MIGRQREAVILSLIENLKCNNSWCGETHIQKATYFLQELLNVPLELDFIIYKHGPYSFDLRDELNIMQSDMILKSISQHPYGARLYPGETSNQLKESYPNLINKYKREINFVAEKLSSKNVSELEKLATALYVSKEEPKAPIQQRAEVINEIKPHVSIEAAKEAVRIVDEFMTELQVA